jgi:peptidyl-prolyl cis-trans isomerase-like 4
MSLLLETTLGDIVIDLDVEGSPELCKNVLKLSKARYYTSTLVYNVQPNRFCQLGDPRGDGSGGACIYGLLDSHNRSDKTEDVTSSKLRFLKSSLGRVLSPQECQEKGRVVATEMNGIADTIGSQLLITIAQGPDQSLDGFRNAVDSKLVHGSTTTSSTELLPPQSFRSVGRVVEDDNHVLDQIAAAYCDANGRPYADIRVIRALVVDDPFEDPPGMDQLLQDRGVVVDEDDDHKIIASPEYERPPEETVENRIQADQIDLEEEEDVEKLRRQQEELLQREDKSRAVVLEMLGDLPSADIKAPENVLFVCKLNPVTEDEDLELIFSRFDEKVKAEIIRDLETGNSLQYAFVEFTTKEQALEAYFKMNNALVDDRRIKVDFSQSVATVWDRFNLRERGTQKNRNMPRDPFGGRDDGKGRQPKQIRPQQYHHHHHHHHRGASHEHHNREYKSGNHDRYDGDNRRPAGSGSRPQHQRPHNDRNEGRDQYRQEEHHENRRQRHSSDDRDARHRFRNENETLHSRSGSNRDYRREEDHENSHHEDRDEFGRRVQSRRSSSPPRSRRRFDSDESDNSSDRSAGDIQDSHRKSETNISRRSRSTSRDRKEKKHKKHKRKREHRDGSRERKRKKKHRKKHHRSREDDSSSK